MIKSTSKQMTLSGKSLLEENIEKSKSILKEFNEDNKLLIGFSGGKDSLLVTDLALETIPKRDVYLIFEDTKIEFKETYEYVDRMVEYYNIDDNHFFRTTPYKKNFWDILEGRDNVLKWVSKWRDCCYNLKKIPLNKVYHKNNFDFVVAGTRKCESSQRSKMKLTSHFDPKSKKVNYDILNPILEWTDNNVWNYIKNNDIPYNPIYDMGYNRCGCAVCPCPNKARDYYSKLYENHPLFYKAIKRRSRNMVDSEAGEWVEEGDTFYRHTWKEVEG